MFVRITFPTPPTDVAINPDNVTHLTREEDGSVFVRYTNGSHTRMTGVDFDEILTALSGDLG